ncbi:MAG: glycine/sarcosine/betaine reductase complex component C subunit beta [Candidatus Binatia bacterium]
MSPPKPVVKAAGVLLIHSPGLVRYGSKPMREISARPSCLEELKGKLRTFDEAESYLPNRVFLGTESPEKLLEVERPWFNCRVQPAQGLVPFGDLVHEEEFIALLAVSDVFRHVSLLDRFWEEIKPRLDQSPLFSPLTGTVPSILSRSQMKSRLESGEGIPLYHGVHPEPVGWVLDGHTEDGSLSAQVLLENLCCKVSATLAAREIFARNGNLTAESVDFILSCSEEAVGDRYQRGGGNLAKAIAEFVGCELSSGVDVKDFCAAPIPAIVIAASLVQSGVFENILVVGGSSLPKLGMKFLYHLEQGMPVLEDVQAAVAVWIGRDDGQSPVINLASVGRHPVRSGEALDRQLKALVIEPLERLEWDVASVDRFVTELHNPDITVPAKGGDVPERSYRMLAAVLASSGKIPRSEVAGFAKSKGVPGYAPTQGHIASSFVYMPHALRALNQGKIRNCFFFARASLFLGQMTQLSDGMSVLLERHP